MAAVAPGIFGLSGIFTDPQFQVIIRALNQKKGIAWLMNHVAWQNGLTYHIFVNGQVPETKPPV